MSKIKSGYITGTNEQLQTIRPYLVEQGFLDDKEWNNDSDRHGKEIIIYGTEVKEVGIFNIYYEGVVASYDEEYRHLYSLSPDEDLKEAAKIIKQKFYG